MLDKDLIKGAIKGNEASMNALYQKYERLWFRLCLRYAKDKQQAEDIFLIQKQYML